MSVPTPAASESGSLGSGSFGKAKKRRLTQSHELYTSHASAPFEEKDSRNVKRKVGPAEAARTGTQQQDGLSLEEEDELFRAAKTCKLNDPVSTQRLAASRQSPSPSKSKVEVEEKGSKVSAPTTAQATATEVMNASTVSNPTPNPEDLSLSLETAGSAAISRDDYVVWLETTQAVQWRGFFDALGPILVEGNIWLREQGIEICAGSTDIWCFAQLFSIEKYEWKMQTEQPVGVNFSLFHKMYKNAKEDSVVALKATQDSLYGPNPHLLTETINDGITVQGKLNILNLEVTASAMPPTHYDNVVDILSTHFKAVVNLLSDHGEECQILYHKEKKALFFHTEGDISSLTPGIEAFENDLQDMSGVQSLRTSSDKKELYALRHLTLISKLTNLSKYVTLFLRQDFPLQLRYCVGTMGHATLTVPCKVEISRLGLADIDLQAHRLLRMKERNIEEKEEKSELREGKGEKNRGKDEKEEREKKEKRTEGTKNKRKRTEGAAKKEKKKSETKRPRVQKKQKREDSERLRRLRRILIEEQEE